MGMENIEKRSFLYGLLKAFTRFWHNKIYYRKVIVLNADNVPEDEPVIFAPNHQNALMDAMAVLCTRPGQPVFLARSDIFRKKTIARILTFFKILPVYRIRDGYSTLKNNEQIFRKTIDVLENKNGLVILPEGNHAPYRRLRSLKKGIARLAFQAAEKSRFSKDIKIVPVGIEYTDYYKFRQQLLVNYGEPISLAAYYDLYREQPNKAIVNLVRDLSDKMKVQMINIEDQQHYEAIDRLREFYRISLSTRWREKFRKPQERFAAQQKLIQILDEFIHRDRESLKNVEEVIREYNQQLEKLNLRSWVLNKGCLTPGGIIWRSLAFLMFLPIFVYGLINNFLPYWLPVKIAGKVKDRVFVSSFKFVLGLLMFPLFHLIQAALVLLISGSWLVAGIYLVSLPLTGYLAFRYYIGFKKFRARLKYSGLSRKSDPAVTRLETLHQRLHQFIEGVVKKV